MSNQPMGVHVYPHVTGMTTGPQDDTAVTAALRALMALDATQLAKLADKLATVDAAFSDRLADALLVAIWPDVPTPMPSERFLRKLVAIADGGRAQPLIVTPDYVYEEFDDDDYYTLPAVAQ